MVAGTLATAHAAARSEAESLAGTLADMPRRAIAHHALYRRSGHGLAFPLMAAHGALWGKRHIDRGLAVGALLFVRALLRYRGGGTGVVEAYQALAWNLGVWFAFIIGSEFFLAYGSEGTFRELFGLALLMVLVVVVVPDDVVRGTS